MPPSEPLSVEPHRVSFTRRSGVLLTWRRGLLLLLLLAVCLLATGLLAYYLRPRQDAAPPPPAGRASPATASDRPPPAAAAAPSDIRLPRHLVPLAYRLRVLPLFEEGDFGFSGAVTVTLRAAAAGDNVTLHVSQLEVANSSVAVRDATAGRPVSVLALVHDVRREFLVLRLQETLVAGHTYDVTVPFAGTLNDKLAGFYRSSYPTPDGGKRWVSETHDARWRETAGKRNTRR